VRLTVRSAGPKQKAYILLKAKEFEQDVPLDIPARMLVTPEKPLQMDFTLHNPESRKAFSFHLLGYGRGAIEVSDFSVITESAERQEAIDERQPQEDETSQSSWGQRWNGSRYRRPQDARSKNSNGPGLPQPGPHADYARSKRSAFITLVQAATKSCTNFSLLSSWA
jgi:hypothetical protein